MRAEDRLQRLEEALDHVRRRAAGNIVVVEGPRDRNALDDLGIGGEHVLINTGKALVDTADALAEHAAGRVVILLTDWDRTGGRLMRTLRDGLVGRIVVDTDCRRRLAAACHERCIEDVPAELRSLRAAMTRP